MIDDSDSGLRLVGKPEPRSVLDLNTWGLDRIGFEVEMFTDGSRYEMREALFRFEERVREQGGTALFHYGDRGVKVNGVNCLS